MKDALILTLGELVRKEISAEQLLHRIVDVMAKLLDADRGTIFILDSDADELVCIAAHLPEIESLRVPKSQGIAGYVARTGRVVNIPFCDTDVRFWKAVDARTGYETISMLAGPVQDSAGHLIGVVQFLNKRSGIFTEEDETYLGTLSKQVAELLEETTLGRGHNFLPTPPPSDAQPDETTLALGDRINRIVGSSRPMRQVFHNILRVASTNAIVLLRGESGTGKGLVARALHHNSPRRDQPLVRVDCTTLPDNLMENELFGHEKGAYTGADRRQLGKVDVAAGGTLFLDEIGDLPLSLQGKLLMLVQERKYQRVGGHQELEADIRIVAATNRDLETLVSQGRFREDLYYRLRVVQITLPALRDRGQEDLHKLINHFVAAAAKRHQRTVRRIHPKALTLLLEHRWPGNVRELENCLESAVIFSDGEITSSNLPLAKTGTTSQHPVLRLNAPGSLSDADADADASTPDDREGVFHDLPTLREVERRYIKHLLRHFDGNRSACARTMDVSRNTLRRKIREHSLE